MFIFFYILHLKNLFKKFSYFCHSAFGRGLKKLTSPSVRPSVDSHSESSLISRSAFQKLFMPSLLKIQNKVKMSEVKSQKLTMSKVNISEVKMSVTNMSVAKMSV